MGNRCTGVLCSDSDAERFVRDEASCNNNNNSSNNNNVVLSTKNLPWRFKRALSDSLYNENDSIIVPPPNYKRRIQHQISTSPNNSTTGRRKTISERSMNYSDLSNSTTENEMSYDQQATTAATNAASTNLAQQRPNSRTHTTTATTNHNNNTSTTTSLLPYTYHCRTMSSETCGREARSEVNLSRRSSTTTCEREAIQDDIVFHRHRRTSSHSSSDDN